jgi:cell division transport system permease protein
MYKAIYLFSEGIKNIWRHKMTALTAIISLSISLYIIGLLFLGEGNTYKILQYFRTKYKIEVFFNQEVGNEEAVGLIHKIKKIKGIRNVTIIEKEDAVRIFKDQFGENIVDVLGYNPLPVSAVVNLERNKKESINVEPIIKSIRNINQINEIKYQGSLIRKIERNFKKISDRLPIISLSVTIIALLIIYNTIKLSIYSRKESIKTLELIGASRLFVKLPFIIEGVLLGLISVIIVIPSLIITVEAVNYLISNFSTFNITLGTDSSVFFKLILMTVFITFFGSYRASSSFLK